MVAARRCRVLILYHNPLFAEGIKSLLEKKEGLEVSAVDATKPGALEYLRRVRPEVVVMEEDGESDGLAVGGIFKERHDVLVIALKLGDNTMNLYYNQQVTVARPEDLTDAILSQWKPHHRE